MTTKNKTLSALNTFFRRFNLLINIGVALWLCLCLYAGYKDSSTHTSILSLFSFTNIFAVAANVGFALFWLFTRKKAYTLISLATLILCFSITRSVFGINLFGKEVADKEVSALKLMTWNVHMFDLGEWSENKQAKNKILDFIKEQEPDIICLQEYYYDKNDPNQPYVELLRNMGYSYYEFSKENEFSKLALTISAKPTDIIKVGHAIFSKFPIKNFERFGIDAQVKSYNVGVVDVMLSEQTTIKLLTTHLQSVSLNSKEVSDAEEKFNKIPTAVDPETKNILKKLLHNNKKRAEQANVIDSIIQKSEFPVILCGDFNDMPGSYVYNKVKGKLSDAFISQGFGLGRTYSKIFPTLRIDYIFYDDNALNCTAFSTPNILLSDHNPVIATFSIRETKPEQ